MKKIILPVAVLTCLAAAAPRALGEVPNSRFPSLGASYKITWAEKGASLADGTIKVIRTFDDPWIFVEYTYMQISTTTQSTTSGSLPAPDSPQAPKPPQANRIPVTKQLWINTNWILTASEIEAE